MNGEGPGELYFVGTSHRLAPIEIRERIAYDEDKAYRWIESLRGAPDPMLTQAGVEVQEAALISTCNRTEAYFVLGGNVPNEALDQDLRHALLRRLLGAHNALLDEHPSIFERRRGSDVPRWLFRVATGVESLVMGEAQILGQVNRAHELARNAGGVGPILERLFQSALHCGKRAHTETEIGRGSVSVASAACELAVKVVGSLRKRSALILGAGETAELTAKHLFDEHPDELWIANRTLAHAEAVCARVGGKPVSLDRLPELLTRVDVVLCATASPEPLVTRVMVQTAVRRRPRPLVFIDIAIPRDVDPAVHTLDNAFVYDMDALDKVVRENLARREREIPRVLTISEDELQHFNRWLTSRASGTLIVELRERCEELRRTEVERGARKRSAEEREVLDRVTRGLLNKLLHGPTSMLRNGAGADPETAALIRRLFQLDTPVRREVNSHDVDTHEMDSHDVDSHGAGGPSSSVKNPDDAPHRSRSST